MRTAKRLLLLTLPLIALLPSCSTDFKVAAPYKNITLVYALLNIDDTAHYIRIQKAFLDDAKSAIDLAQVADSNFYRAQDMDVHLKEFSNGTMVADETLPRVDLNNEHFYQKDTGVFFNAPSFAYKTIRTLVPGNIYRLVIHNKATGEVDSAETPIISNTPTGFLISTIFSGFYTINFEAHAPNEQLTFNFRPPDSAGVFDASLRFHFVSVNNGTGVRTNDSVEMHIDKYSTGSSLYQLYVDEIGVKSFLATAIGPAPSSVSRLMGKVDIFIWAGANAFATYRTINGLQGGLTADQIRPIYTNIRGANTLGLFSSRAVRIRYGAMIDDVTIDSLINGVVTRPLNITGRAN